MTVQKLFLTILLSSVFLLAEAHVLVKSHVYSPNNADKAASYESVSFKDGSFSTTLDGYLLEGYEKQGAGFCVSLVDENTGDILSTTTLASRPKSIGVSSKSLFITDNKGTLTTYSVASDAVQIKGSSVRLRRGPSTNAQIFNDPYTKGPAYPASGDLLACLGQDVEWYKVSYMGEELYVSKRFSEVYKSVASDSNIQLYRLWCDNHQSNSDSAHIVRRPVAFSNVTMDEDGNFIRVGLSRDCAAVFTSSDKDPLFVLEAEPATLHILPAAHCVRHFVTRADGYQREELYFFRGEKLKDVWTCTSEPKDGTQEVQKRFTKTIFGHETEITEQEYFDRRKYIEKAKEFDFISKIKL